jgi:hypothetical protein
VLIDGDEHITMRQVQLIKTVVLRGRLLEEDGEPSGFRRQVRALLEAVVGYAMHTSIAFGDFEALGDSEFTAKIILELDDLVAAGEVLEVSYGS